MKSKHNLLLSSWQELQGQGLLLLDLRFLLVKRFFFRACCTENGIVNSRLEISNRFPWITSHMSADRMTVLRPLGKIKIVQGELGPRRNGKHTCNG